MDSRKIRVITEDREAMEDLVGRARGELRDRMGIEVWLAMWGYVPLFS
jgi:hypothetical protein